MRNFLLSILMFAGLAVAPRAFGAPGSMNTQVELELALEKRVSTLVNRFDPMAVVRVNVAYKKISAPLPGTAIELQNFTASGDDGKSGEISSASVTIYSAKELPDWLKSEVGRLIPEVKAQITVKPLNEDTMKGMGLDENMKISALVAGFLENYKTMSIRLGVGLGIVALMTLFIGSVVAFTIMKRRMVEMDRLIESRLIPVLQNIGSNASENQGGGSRPQVLQATLTAPAGGFRGGESGGGGGGGSAQQDIAYLSLETLENIFADCYWCERDGYAAWLWSAMTPQQRTQLCSSTVVDPAYLKAIQVQPKERQDDHLDPAYLSPLKIQHLSQKDIARWVEGFLPGYNLLSPMRQASLPVSLKTRLACMNEPIDAKTKVPAVPDRASPKRKLVVIQTIGDITADDEATILHNPAMVPDMLRAQLRSLVWLALRPFEVRQKALNEFSAEEIASAWSASPEVLARLAEALPEKKRAMLEGYLKSVELNRKAYVFTRLVDAGLAGQIEASSEKGSEPSPTRLAS